MKNEGTTFVRKHAYHAKDSQSNQLTSNLVSLHPFPNSKVNTKSNEPWNPRTSYCVDSRNDFKMKEPPGHLLNS